ncbi:MAG: hypothetical protein ACR2GA_06205 [Chloroflexota bacterium]
MRRYLDTFQRLWFIVLVPILVLPIASVLWARSQPTKQAVTANIWVDQTSARLVGNGNPYITASGTVSSYFTELLRTSSFDLSAARAAPLYWRPLAHRPNAKDLVQADLSKQVQAQSGGANLVTLTYQTTAGAAGKQLLRSVLREAAHHISGYYQQGLLKNKTALEAQLKQTRSQLATASTHLSAYLTKHQLTPQDVPSQELADPHLQALTQAVQSNQSSVKGYQQQIATLSGASALSGAFRVVDKPSAAASATSKKAQILPLGIGVLLGLLLGLGFLVARTAMDQTLHFADEVPMLLNLPVLAVVPHNRGLRTKAPRQARQAKAVVPAAPSKSAEKAG